MITLKQTWKVYFNVTRKFKRMFEPTLSINKQVILFNRVSIVIRLYNYYSLFMFKYYVSILYSIF